MRLVSFTSSKNSDTRLGALLDDSILDLNLATGGKTPSSMLEFLQNSASNLRAAQEAAKNPKKENLIPLKEAQLKAPLPNPPALKDFFAFEDHAKAGSKRRGVELQAEWYEIPAYYKGSHREIYGPGDTIPWPAYTEKLDFECEVACVVGRKGKNLSPEEALQHIFGYVIYNDYSARDIQRREMRLLFGPNKGKDFANAFGPYILTADEADPVKDFSMQVWVNGEKWSEGHFKNQRWGFPLMLSYVSQEETVHPGDILGSGTFFTGCGLDLDKWIKPGDSVELRVNKLGSLRNVIGTKPAQMKEMNYKALAEKAVI